MTSKYLTGTDLSTKIRQTLSEPNPKMCVAFLGPNWTSEMFKDKLPTDLKIICDLQMGVTSKQALLSANAPENKKLRHLPGVQMHAKVYLSDKGAVICSANASKSALETNKRIEDGVWFSADDPNYERISKEFESRWKRSKKVGKKDLEKAPVFMTGGANNPDDSAPKTLLELIKSNPAVFHGIRFVCTDTNNDPNVVENAFEMTQDEAETNGEFYTPALTKKRYRFFQGWELTENDWPTLFISMHMQQSGRFYIAKHQRLHVFDSVPTDENGETVDVCVSRAIDWRKNGVSFGDLPKLATQKACREELEAVFTSRELYSSFAGQILTAKEFASLLTEANF